MIFDKNKLKVIVIDYPLLALDDPFCASLLGKVQKMKYDGYAITYGDKIVPMDKTDFFGTHIILCEEKDGEFFPIFAYKSVSLERCLFHEVEFPILSIMKSDGRPECLAALNVIFESARPSEISYDSAWAQNLDYRFSKTSELKELLAEITMMFTVSFHHDFNLPHILTNGVVKVKTDQFFERMGLKRLTDDENSKFNQKLLNNEECVIFHTDSFSLEARIMAKKHKNLWDDKLLIDGLSIQRSARAELKAA